MILAPLACRPCAPPPRLPALRNLDFLLACEEMGLARLVTWVDEILCRPQDCCDVVALPAHVYVHMARKLHVSYEGPPTPSALSPHASLEFDSPSLRKLMAGSPDASNV